VTFGGLNALSQYYQSIIVERGGDMKDRFQIQLHKNREIILVDSNQDQELAKFIKLCSRCKIFLTIRLFLIPFLGCVKKRKLN